MLPPTQSHPTPPHPNQTPNTHPNNTTTVGFCFPNDTDIESDYLKDIELTPVQRWYLCFTAQESVRLTNAILEVKERQNQKSRLLLEAKSEYFAYLVRLLHFDEEEYRFLVAQQVALRNSIRTAISIWSSKSES